MSDLSEVITAVVAAAGVCGSGIGFIWHKVERRFAEIELKLEACESREDEGQKRRARQLIVIELLWQEIERLAPDGPMPKVLARAKQLLDDLKISNDGEGEDR